MEQRKSITLHPTWKSWFWSYLAGFLLIPLFGSGLLVLWVLQRWRRSETYHIYDDAVVRRSGDDEVRLDLDTIDSVELSQSVTERWLDAGTVRLKANVTEIALLGMENPENLVKTIRTAVEASKKAKEKQQKQQRTEPEYDPGTLDKLDYLTGLWQQGLISDEDYHKEKQHFER